MFATAIPMTIADSNTSAIMSTMDIGGLGWCLWV